MGVAAFYLTETTSPEIPGIAETTPFTHWSGASYTPNNSCFLVLNSNSTSNTTGLMIDLANEGGNEVVSIRAFLLDDPATQVTRSYFSRSNVARSGLCGVFATTSRVYLAWCESAAGGDPQLYMAVIDISTIWNSSNWLGSSMERKLTITGVYANPSIIYSSSDSRIYYAYEYNAAPGAMLLRVARSTLTGTSFSYYTCTHPLGAEISKPKLLMPFSSAAQIFILYAYKDPQAVWRLNLAKVNRPTFGSFLYRQVYATIGQNQEGYYAFQYTNYPYYEFAITWSLTGSTDPWAQTRFGLATVGLSLEPASIELLPIPQPEGFAGEVTGLALCYRDLYGSHPCIQCLGVNKGMLFRSWLYASSGQSPDVILRGSDFFMPSGSALLGPCQYGVFRNSFSDANIKSLLWTLDDAGGLDPNYQSSLVFSLPLLLDGLFEQEGGYGGQAYNSGYQTDGIINGVPSTDQLNIFLSPCVVPLDAAHSVLLYTETPEAGGSLNLTARRVTSVANPDVYGWEGYLTTFDPPVVHPDPGPTVLTAAKLDEARVLVAWPGGVLVLTVTGSVIELGPPASLAGTFYTESDASLSLTVLSPSTFLLALQTDGGTVTNEIVAGAVDEAGTISFGALSSLGAFGGAVRVQALDQSRGLALWTASGNTIYARLANVAGLDLDLGPETSLSVGISLDTDSLGLGRIDADLALMAYVVAAGSDPCSAGVVRPVRVAEDETIIFGLPLVAVSESDYSSATEHLFSQPVVLPLSADGRRQMVGFCDTVSSTAYLHLQGIIVDSDGFLFRGNSTSVYRGINTQAYQMALLSAKRLQIFAVAAQSENGFPGCVIDVLCPGDVAVAVRAINLVRLRRLRRTARVDGSLAQAEVRNWRWLAPGHFGFDENGDPALIEGDWWERINL